MNKCIYCNTLIGSGNRKRKFCSDKHKVAYSRLSEKEKKELIDKFKNERIKDLDIHYAAKLLKWVKPIKDFCDENNIEPLDLIECYKRNSAKIGDNVSIDSVDKKNLLSKLQQIEEQAKIETNEKLKNKKKIKDYD